ncbi:MAG TPA: hypothetical protein VK502_02645 [Candidatus Saccharimonadales bacterium]|nr:hypothetical protein [Candidatus Saccharimonadales bacterium]
MQQHGEASSAGYILMAFLLIVMLCSLFAGANDKPFLMGSPLLLTAFSVVAMVAAGLHVIGVERWIDRILVSTLQDLSVMNLVWACIAATASVGVFIVAIKQRNPSTIIGGASVLLAAASLVFQAVALRTHAAPQDALSLLQNWSEVLAIFMLAAMMVRFVWHAAPRSERVQ